MNKEQEFISALAEIFKPSTELLVGIGDDAAVVTQMKQNVVASADMAIEGVHFKNEWSSKFQIGAKTATANIADIFAMGAQPKYLLVSAGLPVDTKLESVRELALGIKSVADRFSVHVIGGDITRAANLVLSISAIGQVETPILRSGAEVNDYIFVTGLTGWSALGLSILQQTPADKGATQKISDLLQNNGPVLAHLNPYLVSPAKLFPYINSLTDISDGLVIDLASIASNSGVTMTLDSKLLAKLPGFDEFNELAKLYGEIGLELILQGGEDHLFIGTISEENLTKLQNEKVSDSIFIIGKVKSFDGENQVLLDGKRQSEGGFKHF